MSDKPEKIYISDLGVDDLGKALDVVQVSKTPDDWMKHEYIRADLAKPSGWVSVATGKMLEEVGLMRIPELSSEFKGSMEDIRKALDDAKNR